MNVLQRGAAIADFDQPLQLLKACHERIQKQCDTLQRLCAHLPVHGCDAQAQQAASNVMRYFDSAGRHHHEDEEQDLLPRMAASAKGQDAERVALLTGQIMRDHQELDRDWLMLRESLEKIAHGDFKSLDAQEVNQFCDRFGKHMAYEEANLFPMAQGLLNDEAFAAIGNGMAARRGVR